MYTHTRTRARARARAHTRTHVRARTHARARARTHTHTHTHTPGCVCGQKKQAEILQSTALSRAHGSRLRQIGLGLGQGRANTNFFLGRQSLLQRRNQPTRAQQRLNKLLIINVCIAYSRQSPSIGFLLFLPASSSSPSPCLFTLLLDTSCHLSAGVCLGSYSSPHCDFNRVCRSEPGPICRSRSDSCEC